MLAAMVCCDQLRKCKKITYSERSTSLYCDQLTSSATECEKHLFSLFFSPVELRAAPFSVVHRMQNPLLVSRMSADERLAEIAEILAAGLMRMRMLKSTCLSADRRDSSLDCLAHPSGHAGKLLSTEPTS